jgi:hypothetical protein
VTAFSHVSADGKHLCLPTTDARALDMPLSEVGPSIDQRVRDEGLNSYLRVYDTESGEELACVQVPSAWVTHVQFSIQEPQKILYNHEWTYRNTGWRRMWMFLPGEKWDKHFPLRFMAGRRHPEDWVCHETRSRDGEEIFYHGRYHQGPAFVGRMRADGGGLEELAFPQGWTKYGHFTAGPGGLLVTDGYYQAPGDPKGEYGEWISLLKPDWQARKLEWIPLCKHGSSWKSQDCHPHPIFDHAGKNVCFTSDKEGKRAIFKIGFKI